MRTHFETLTLYAKIVAENWDSKEPSAGTIFRDYGLDNIFLGIKAWFVCFKQMKQGGIQQLRGQNFAIF